MEKLDHSSTAGRNVKWCSHKFGNFFRKTATSIPPISYPFGRLAQSEKNHWCSHNNLYVKVYGSFIQNSPKLEANPISFNEWKLYHETYSAIKRANYWYTQQPGWISRELSQRKKPIRRVYVIYDSICVTFLKCPLVAARG